MTEPKTYRLNAQGVENLAAFREACQQHQPLIPVLKIPTKGGDGPLSFKLESAESICDADLLSHALRMAAMSIDPARCESERRKAEIYHKFCEDLANAWREDGGSE